MKIILPTLLLAMFSLSVTAQDVKSKVSARPSERQEIAADNRLKKSIQQKQLSAPPTRISDAATTSNTGKKVNSKKSSCCIKKKPKV